MFIIRLYFLKSWYINTIHFDKKINIIINTKWNY